jgi:hypothetical protein
MRLGANQRSSRAAGCRTFDARTRPAQPSRFHVAPVTATDASTEASPLAPFREKGFVLVRDPGDEGLGDPPRLGPAPPFREACVLRRSTLSAVIRGLLGRIDPKRRMNAMATALRRQRERRQQEPGDRQRSVPSTSASMRFCSTVSARLRRRFPSRPIGRIAQRHPVVGHGSSLDSGWIRKSWPAGNRGPGLEASR